MKNVYRIILLIILASVLLLLGTCCFKNCRDNGGLPAPAATYRVTVKVTNSSYFTDNITTREYETYKVITLHGYYELFKGKYVFKDVNLPLDERKFGKIEVRLND